MVYSENDHNLNFTDGRTQVGVHKLEMVMQSALFSYTFPHTRACTFKE